MSEQAEFRSGRLISRTEIKPKEVISVFYILIKAEIDDNLRAIINKLPVWVRHKNDIERIFNKLVKLEIVRIKDATGGARITEISESAVNIAKDAINDIEVWQELLNGDDEWFPTYPYI
jgi:hypothetical protein